MPSTVYATAAPIQQLVPALSCLVLVLAASALSCGRSSDPSEDVVRVAAAASLRDLVTELATEFERQHDVAVELNFAGSNTLALQIEAAAQADVFLSAHHRWVEYLAERGRLVAGSQKPMLGNELVAVARPDAPEAVRALASSSDVIADLVQVAITESSPTTGLVLADPAAVPAGIYTRQRLELAGHWQRIQPRVIPALDVRAALALVASDPALVGIVYRTDAATSEDVEILFALPPHPEVTIGYWLALVDRGTDGDHDAAGQAARDFVELVLSPQGQRVAARHGFVTPTAPSPTSIDLGPPPGAP